MAAELVYEEAFDVLLANDLCLNNGGLCVLKVMAVSFKQIRSSIVAVIEVPQNQVHKYGVVAGVLSSDNLIKVNTMVEKPSAEDAPSNLAEIGRYILTPDIFNIIENLPAGENGEIQLIYALSEQAKNGYVIAYKFKGYCFDCGSMDGSGEATSYYYKNYHLKIQRIFE